MQTLDNLKKGDFVYRVDQSYPVTRSKEIILDVASIDNTNTIILKINGQIELYQAEDETCAEQGRVVIMPWQEKYQAEIDRDLADIKHLSLVQKITEIVDDYKLHDYSIEQLEKILEILESAED